jgi:hypothetical protein
LRKHGLKKVPLGVRAIGIENSIFHRPNGGFAESGKDRLSSACQRYLLLFISFLRPEFYSVYATLRGKSESSDRLLATSL